jgi:hypothetical protein
VLPSIAKGALALQRAKKSVTARLAQLTAPTPDKSDVVSFFKRESIRDALRNLPRDQRENLISRHLADLSRDVLQAVVEDEPFPWIPESERLVSSQTREALQRQLVRQAHPEAVSELTEIEEALKIAEPVVNKATSEIQVALGMRVGEFDRAVEVEAAKKPPVWVKKVGSEMRVLLYADGSDFGTSRPATAEDLAVGQEFSDVAAYRAALNAAA